MSEILLIDKPAGITSFDVIRRLRRSLGIKKMGHAGTLDPLATGLMIIGINDGTKKLTEYIKLDKEYVAEIRVGESRSTGDLEGEVVAEKPVLTLARPDVEAVIGVITGSHTLPVSAYSAIKRNGVPLYKTARRRAARGEVVTDLPLRTMTVYEAELKDFTLNPETARAILTVRFFVGSGTYIRSLAEEIGRHLGYPATLQSLRRTKIGTFDVTDAHSI